MDKAKMDKAAKIFSVALGILFVYALCTGLLPRLIAGDTYRRFMGGDAPTADPKYMELLVHHVRMVGLMGTGLTLLTLYAVWTGFRRAEKWALFAIVIGGGLGIGTLMGEHMAIKAWPLFIADNIGMAPIGTALSMTIREFFPKKDKKAEPTNG